MLVIIPMKNISGKGNGITLVPYEISARIHTVKELLQETVKSCLNCRKVMLPSVNFMCGIGR